MRKTILRLKGVGWRSSIESRGGNIPSVLVLNVGKSHAVEIPVKPGINIKTLDQSGTVLEVSSNLPDSSVLPDFISRVIGVRKWNSYTQGGVVQRYTVDENNVYFPRAILRSKVGKRK